MHSFASLPDSVAPPPDPAWHSPSSISQAHHIMVYRRIRIHSQSRSQHSTTPITAAVLNCNGQGDANVHAGQREIRPGQMHHSRLSDSATEIGASEPMCTGDILQRQESGIDLRGAG